MTKLIKNAHLFRFHGEEVDIGEWEDENQLNYDTTDIKEFEKYFK